MHMKNKLINLLLMLLIFGACLVWGSCSFPRIYVDIINQTSSTVHVSFSHGGLRTQNHPLCYDTIRYEIKAGMREKIGFPVFGNKRSIEKLVKQIPFIILETPTKSKRFKETDEIIKMFSKRTAFKYEYEFVITDSLFDSGK